MLGAAGTGKTSEHAYLADLDRTDGFEVTIDRLAVLGQTPESLTSCLDRLAAAATSKTVFFLDALDEVMVPVRTAGLIIQRWVTEKLASARPRLRLTCRSAVWPPGVQSAIEAVYGADACAFAVLQPLSEEDVLKVAHSRGIDAKGFLRAVDAAGVRALSEQPLTLEMLLKIHETHGTLPNQRRDLFRQGIEQLSRERRERTRDGTALTVPTAQILEAAERLACFCLLSGRDTIDLSESPSSIALAAREVEGLPGGDRPLDNFLIDAICRSGLCEGDGPDRFRFAHRQFAEYLAGRRIAKLLPHQVKALLGAGTSSQSAVVGPLRETAAFAAMESDAVAEWVSTEDPEVVGLSDVADASLRRSATLNLLEKFRRKELTDSQTGRDGIELAGFQYPGAEKELRPVLRERQENCQDIIACAIGLIKSWGLASMSDDIASLMLDSTAPVQNRKSAGYVLAEIGTPEARRRLLPLIAGGPDDSYLDLKGLALRCNWPEGLSVPDLLTVLTPAPPSNYHGPYKGFFHQLDHEGFDARGHRVQGLKWARQFVQRNHEDSLTSNLVRRIAIGALDEFDAPGVADALADLILDAAEGHAGSPLQPPHQSSLGKETGTPPPILTTETSRVRRRLIDALTARATKDRELWEAARGTPGLLATEDFPWLVERVVDQTISMSQRENYADLARMLPWMDSAECVEDWLRTREIEPIASRMSYPLAVKLDSEEATKARRLYAESKRCARPQKRRRLHPSPHERVEQLLALSETKDPRFFLNLCQELTLEDDGMAYGFSRFLARTPGWIFANEATRARIVESAKRFLSVTSDEPERVRTQPLNSVLPGHMAAIWLVTAHDPAWTDARPPEWWRKWTWYILRELRPHLSDEPEEPKIDLLRRLHTRAPKEVRENVLQLVRSSEPETHSLLTSLLGAFEEIDDGALDEYLCEDLARGAIPVDRVSEIAQFVLTRSSGRALNTCLSCLEPNQVAARENCAVRAVVALLHERTREAWPRVFDLLRRRPDLAGRALCDFAHTLSLRARHADRHEPVGLAALSPAQIGQLLSLLIESFPPESDPQYVGAHSVTPSDSARQMRNQLISWLGDQKDVEAVETLRTLERTYGAKYPWLRRPRAHAERAYLLSHFDPIAPSLVAKVLASQNKRFLRSGGDALDGVVAAVEDYQRRLKQESPSELDDLWNQTKGAVPTPKEEERVSDKVCVAVRKYFRDFAVAANREVQVFRRRLPKSLGGAPGSEVDVLCEVLAAGCATDDPLKIPVEVKLAHNPEARTGMRDQLVERYMSELGTGLGLYVVVWMGRGEAGGRYRPLWRSPEDARAEFADQAKQMMAASPEPMDIRVVVIDASLPLATKHRKPSLPRRRGSRFRPGGSAMLKKKAKRKPKGHMETRSATRSPRKSRVVARQGRSGKKMRKKKS